MIHVILWHHQNIQLDPLSTGPRFLCHHRHHHRQIPQEGEKDTELSREEAQEG